MSSPTTITKYLKFLQDVLSASNCKTKIVPDQLIKKHSVGNYAYTAIKELGFIKVKDGVVRGPQIPVWQLKCRPTAEHANELSLAIASLYEESEQRRLGRVKKDAIKSLFEHTATVSFGNNHSMEVASNGNIVEFEINGELVRVVFPN